MVTSIPRKQRKNHFNAPLHIKQNKVCASVSNDLKATTGKKTMRVKKNYQVEVLRGENKGKKGKVTRVILKTCKIYIDGVTTNKADGKEANIPLDPSNVRIIKVDSKKTEPTSTSENKV
jgi:large subunit ribosomal protein L24